MTDRCMSRQDVLLVACLLVASVGAGVPRAQAQWTDVTTGALADTIPTHGLTWVDFDNDGDLDLYVADNGRNLLLRNDGQDPQDPGLWLFTDVAAADPSGLGDASRGRLGLWGDFDNDGDLDLYLVNEYDANRLLRNDPQDPGDPADTNRVFVDVTTPVLEGVGTAHSANWVDYDRDGDLDLFLANLGANQLLRNGGVDPDTGLPVFTDVTAAVGLSGVTDTQSSAWGDYDGDGDQDLYLVNYQSANVLWRNDPADPARPDGPARTFTMVGAGTDLADTGPGRGGVWGDYDGDGDLDLFVTNYGVSNLLLRNDGGDVFTDVAALAGLEDAAGKGRGCAWIDYDNDGDLDLYVVNFDDEAGTPASRLWRNDGAGVGPGEWLFTDVADSVLAVDGGLGSTAAWADYDGDGDLDVYLAFWDSAHANRLVRNDGAAGHWLHVSLVGRAANRSAMGARLDLYAGGRDMVREVPGGDGYLSQNTLVAEFGLGGDTQADSLVVAWPSGNRQVLGALAADQWLEVTEPGPDTPRLDPLPPYGDDGQLTVSWSDESASGATLYEVVAAVNVALDTLWASSGWIADSTYTFTGLLDGQRLYYRVRARDAAGFHSGWSAPETSVQDGLPPVSSVDALPDTVAGLPFSVPYTASDAGSGVAQVTLYYAHDDTAQFAAFATRTDGQPFLFTIPDGEGTYYFYTVAEDSIGLVEAPPAAGYDAAVVVLPPEWVNVAPLDGSGVGNDGNGRGAAWGDFDGDGRLDLFLSNRPVWSTGADATNHLFHNDGPDGNGGWVFSDVTPGVMSDGGYSQGVAWGDFDGDGDLDLYQSNMQVSPSYPAPNRLYRNDGGGVFTDIAPAAGVDDGGSGRSVSWVDYDGDGDLDLYLCNDGPNHLYRNDGPDPQNPDGWLFTDVAPQDGTGIGDDQYTMGCAWADVDNDGDPDLYLTNYQGGANRLFRNDGEDPQKAGVWVFTDVAATAGVADAGNGMGCVFGDYDNDGWLDLYITNNGANRLFHHVPGQMLFEDVTAVSGEHLDDAQYGAGCSWIDYDNDGDLDLYIGNHWPDSGPQYAANFLMRNDGEDPLNPGTWVFTDVAPAGGYGIADSASTNSVAWCDFDGDGDQDIYLVAMTGEPNKLLRNDTPAAAGNHWLQVDLVAHQANSNAIGARLRAVAGGIAMIREVGGGSGFLSQNAPTVPFGLGSAVVVDTLEIFWPSGVHQVLTGLAADQRLTIEEPGPHAPVMTAEPLYTAGTGNTVAWSDESASGAVLYRVQLAAAADFLTVLADTTVADTSVTFTGLADGFTGWYRVRAVDADSLVSAWSLPVFSTQDASPPSSVVEPITILYPGSPFDVVYTAADSVSGVNQVSLYYAYDGQANFTLYDTRTDGQPFHFTLPDGPGLYYFYTIAVDGVGNTEAAPEGGFDRMVWVGPPLWVDIAPPGGRDGNSRAVAFADYDGDGRQDFFLANRPVWFNEADATNHLLHNTGPAPTDTDSVAFRDVTPPVMADGSYTNGLAWGDFDGDGDLDLYQANMYVNPDYPAPNRLYRNDGGGVFTDIAPLVGVDDGGSGRTVAWVDFDRDGDLDLYLCNDGPNHLWRNDGPDTTQADGWLFTDIAADTLGIGDSQYTMGCAWGDFDNDGDPDVYLANYAGGVNRLLRNDGPDSTVVGGWRFTDVAPPLGMDDTESSVGCAWGDFDDDGWLDLYVTNRGPNRLYHNISGMAKQLPGVETYDPADGRPGPAAAGAAKATTAFVEIAALYQNGLADSLYGAGLGWADIDNDGDLDLFVGNHWANDSGDSAPDLMFRNDGPDSTHAYGWLFTNIAPPSGENIGDDASTNGVAWADVDNDGDLDLYMATMSGLPNRLFRNDLADSSGNHWLQVDLRSLTANTTAIGARVRVVAGGRSMNRYVQGNTGFLSQGSQTLQFGLAGVTLVDTLEVFWPTGEHQMMLGVPGDQRLLIQQVITGVDDPAPALPPLVRLEQNYPNPFNPSTVIRFALPREQRARLAVYALDGSRVRVLVDGVLAAGAHRVVWDGRAGDGARLASGVYFYRLETPDGAATRRMLMVK